jgi:aspartate kinase
MSVFHFIGLFNFVSKQKTMKVFKFGGASVKDANAVRNVSTILSRFSGEKLIVVVSAMGKTTNKLEEIVEAERVKNLGQFTNLVNELYDFHIDILGQLFQEKHFKIYNEIDQIFDKIRERFNKPFPDNFSFEYDQIVSLGEVISSKIVSAYLFEQGFSSGWADAREIIRTNNQFQEGKVDWVKTEELVNARLMGSFRITDILVTQGFIGHTPEGFTTTLGREGSDYTAGIFAYCTNAESVTIWKDVPGMLNADPKYFTDTVKLDQISFKEAIELSYYGASVIHPKTIKPLQNKGIPLYVKSFINPDEPGTIIQESTDKDNLVPSFIVKKDQVLFSIRPTDFSFIAEENLSDIFNRFATKGIKINVMQNSALSFSILVDRKKISPDLVKEVLGINYKVWYNDELELVTIRHYDQKTIDLVTKGKTIILEQKTRQTIRIILK